MKSDVNAMEKFFAVISDVRILCIGDVMLDRYVHGKVDRISPEGPIPVLTCENQTTVAGGSANVARNVTALGAHCALISVVGDDSIGEELRQLLAEDKLVAPNIVIDSSRSTTEKTRFVASGQQLLRMDKECTTEVSADIEQMLLRNLDDLIAVSDVIVLSDYAKGVLTQSVIDAVIRTAKECGKPIVVDPKAKSFARYSGASIITPNAKEAEAVSGIYPGNNRLAEEAGMAILAANDFDAVLITRAQQGLTMVHRDGNIRHSVTTAREVYDVSGAGDTLVAVLAVALGAGVVLEDAIEIANAAAGVSVGKAGTATVSPMELRQAAEVPFGVRKKIRDLTAAREVRERWRNDGLRVVFTNGCFDLLHRGHIHLLNYAKGHGDRLIVGLNSDASVARLKGPTRPIQRDEDRAAVLAALQAIDLVVVFGEDTPELVLQSLRPDVLVKGADYKLENVVGADFVMSYGGAVELCPTLAGYATTTTVARISGAKPS